jgi:hypothetical protein
MIQRNKRIGRSICLQRRRKRAHACAPRSGLERQYTALGKGFRVAKAIFTSLRNFRHRSHSYPWAGENIRRARRSQCPVRYDWKPVKTALIDGTSPDAFDENLLNALEMTCAPSWAVRSEAFLIGVLNDRGEIYRIVGVSDLRAFADLLDRLRMLRCLDEIADGADAEQGFDTIVSTPHARAADKAMPGKQSSESHKRPWH